MIDSEILLFRDDMGMICFRYASTYFINALCMFKKQLYNFMQKIKNVHRKIKRILFSWIIVSNIRKNVSEFVKISLSVTTLITATLNVTVGEKYNRDKIYAITEQYFYILFLITFIQLIHDIFKKLKKF